VTGAVQLLGGGQTGRSRSHNGHPFASAHLWDLWLNPALLEGMIDDGALDILDRDRRLRDAQDAGSLARSGTHATSELGEVVGLQQLTQCLLPLTVEDEVVPLGNDVAQRAASGVGLTEGHTALHAAGSLDLEVLAHMWEVVNLVPILLSLPSISVRSRLPLVLHKAAGLVQHAIGTLLLERHILDGLLDVLNVRLMLSIAILDGGLQRLLHRLLFGHVLESLLVFVREDLDELALGLGPVIQQLLGHLGARLLDEIGQQFLDQINIFTYMFFLN